MSTSLREDHPRRLDIPAVAVAALGCLIAGQLLPVATISKLGSGEDTYSILGSVLALVRSGNPLLALVIVSFSVVFPFFKLTALGIFWVKRTDASQRANNVRRLEILGKWSMLDVFVVVVLTGAVRLGILAEASPEPGIYVFSTAIVLSLVATFLMARMSEVGAGTSQEEMIPRHVAVLSLLALGLFVAGLFSPLLSLEKWRFWHSDYCIVTGAWNLWMSGEWFLGLTVLLFVVLLPCVHLGSLAAFAVSRRHRFLWVRTLSRWSMMDVFGLAVLVVIVKIGRISDVQPRPGLWLLVAAACVSVYVTWRIEREQ